MKRAAWYLAAPLVCLAVFWRMPFIWFRTDDFAWLGLPLEVHDFHSLMWVLFRPEAQGTVRVLSERVFFLTLSSLFGTWAAPFRVVTLATWFATLILAAWIGAWLTGSKRAGMVAAILWTSSFAVVTPIVWASGYNQVLCSLLLLTALYGRIRWLDSGERKWLALEWTAYLLGFGALEITVMYPAAAALYTWVVARSKERGVVALFIPAAIFSAVHFFLIPKTTVDIYRIVVDARLPVTLMRYVKVALGPAGADIPKSIPMALAIVCSLALGGFLIWRLKGRDGQEREGMALFCAAWFLLFLLPVLPLPNHFSVYYLTLPLIGLCWLAGAALSAAYHMNRLARGASLLLTGLWLLNSIAGVEAGATWWLEHTSKMRLLVRAVEQAADEHPGTALILKDVDTEMFQAGFQDDPFRLSGISRVYLAPGSEDSIQSREDLGGVTRFRITPADALRLIGAGQARVLDLNDGPPRDITRRFGASLAAEFSASHRGLVDVADPLYASRLGSGWYPAESGFRWMSKTGVVRLAIPLAGAHQLSMSGYGAVPALAAGPVTLRVHAGEQEIGSCTVSRANEKFTCDFPLPAKLAGEGVIDVSVDASRTFSPPGDVRQLAMVFGSFELK